MARETRTLEPVADEPEVGRWLAAMADARRDTLRELDGVHDGDLAVLPPGADNSLGSLLYHLALIEADWLVDEVMGLSDEEFDRSPLGRWFPESDRDGEGRLTGLASEALAGHLERLAAVRAALVDQVRVMSVEDFHEPRARERYDVSPAWVLHHLLQHEAEHRSEIVRLRREIAAG